MKSFISQTLVLVAAALLALVASNEARAGTTLVEQGQPSQGVHVLLSGAAEVVLFDGSCNLTLTRLVPGDVFGEISILTDQAATASVVVPRRCWLLSLPEADVQDFLRTEPRLHLSLRRIAEERQHENDERFGMNPVLDYKLDLV